MFAATADGIDMGKDQDAQKFELLPKVEFGFKVAGFLLLQTVFLVAFISNIRADVNANSTAISQMRTDNAGLVRKFDDLSLQMNSIVLKQTTLDINVTNQGKILDSNAVVLGEISKNVDKLSYGTRLNNEHAH